MKFKLIFLLSLISAGIGAQDQSDPWKPAEIVSPAQVAAELKKPDSARHVLFVGFPILYKGAHISEAAMAGPCLKKEGVDRLTEELKGVSHEAEIVVYCGCCPFVKCPNIRPAYRALKDMGYTNIKVLELPTNLHSDWVEKGYPIEASATK